MAPRDLFRLIKTKKWTKVASEIDEAPEEQISYISKRPFTTSYLNYNCVHLAVELRAPRQILSKLVGKGIDVNASGECGFTALHLAVAHGGNEETVRLLLDLGADVNAECYRETPLNVAMRRHSNVGSIELLLANGADVNNTRYDGQTPLHCATQHRNATRVIELLLDHGCDVNTKAAANRTPLHDAAASEARPEVVELLLRKGAEINAKTEDGRTPLHLAAQKNNQAVVEVLLRHGADQNARSNSGKTALDCARQRNYSDVVALLSSPPPQPVQDDVPVAEPENEEEARTTGKLSFEEQLAQSAALCAKLQREARRMLSNSLTGNVQKLEEQEQVLRKKRLRLQEHHQRLVDLQQREARAQEQVAQAQEALEAIVTELSEEQETIAQLQDDVTVILRQGSGSNPLQCKVCFEETISRMFIPCSHVVCCATCSDQIQSCPTCRSHISAKKPVFLG